MMDQPREMPAYDDLDPMPGQRLPWQHGDATNESRMETDPDRLPGDPPAQDDDDEDDDEAGLPDRS